MNPQKYLKRINYQGKIKPNLETLGLIQKSHLLHVPFENLDIHYHTPIELDTDRIYKKIVERHRGGFCYELNGLYFKLLKSLEFKVKMVSARGYSLTNGFGAEYDHLTIIAHIDGVNYLTDVGFGEFAFAPLEIKLNQVQNDHKGDFIIEKYDDFYFLVNKKVEDKWFPQYLFSLKKRDYREYQGMCTYHQTSSESHFTQKRLCSLPTENGRITITGDLLKITNGKDVEEIKIKDEGEFYGYLMQYFKMKL